MDPERLPKLYRIYININNQLPEQLKMEFSKVLFFIYKKFVNHCRKINMKDIEIMLQWTQITFYEVTDEYLSLKCDNMDKLYKSIRTNNFVDYFIDFDKYVQEVDKYIDYSVNEIFYKMTRSI